MSQRLPSAEAEAPADLVASIKARRGTEQLLNLDRILLHAPAAAVGWNAMFGALRSCEKLDPVIRELVILDISLLNDAPYEWQQHEPAFLAEGGTPAMLEALRAGDTEAFTAAQRAALNLCREMTRNIRVPDAVYDAVRETLPGGPHALVELTLVIAGYNMVSRVLVAHQIELEK